jgi:hypothetical protein
MISPQCLHLVFLVGTFSNTLWQYGHTAFRLSLVLYETSTDAEMEAPAFLGGVPVNRRNIPLRNFITSHQQGKGELDHVS